MVTYTIQFLILFFYFSVFIYFSYLLQGHQILKCDLSCLDECLPGKSMAMQVCTKVTSKVTYSFYTTGEKTYIGFFQMT